MYLGWLWEGYCCPGSTGTTSFIQNESSFLEVKAYEILYTVTILFAG